MNVTEFLTAITMNPSQKPVSIYNQKKKKIRLKGNRTNKIQYNNQFENIIHNCHSKNKVLLLV